MTSNRGFSIIELMFALCLSAIIAMLAVPLTSHWVNNSRQLQARGEVVGAVARARAISLRNAEGLAANSTAASVRLDGSLLEVRDGKGTVVWSAQIPSSIRLKYSNGDPFECVAYDTRGGLRESGACKAFAEMSVQTSGQENLNAPLL